MTDEHADLIKAAREHSEKIRADRLIRNALSPVADLLEKLADALEKMTSAAGIAVQIDQNEITRLHAECDDLQAKLDASEAQRITANDLAAEAMERATKAEAQLREKTTESERLENAWRERVSRLERLVLSPPPTVR